MTANKRKNMVEQNNNADEASNSNQDDIIVIENLTKKFGNSVVLDNISLKIEKGKTTVIIGPSGCGKTVLIKHIIVLLRPSSGEVYFNAWHRIAEDGQEKDLIVGGRYIDAYSCKGGEWRIQKRAMVVDWSRTDNEDDNFTKGNDDMLVGVRDKADFSYARNWKK